MVDFSKDLLAENDSESVGDVTAPEHRPSFVRKALQKGMVGELHKYSPAIFKAWQRRLCVLNDHQLKYYKKSDQGEWN